MAKKPKGKQKPAARKKGGNAIVWVVAALIAGGVGYLIWGQGGGEEEFLKSAAKGKSARSEVKTIPSRGTTHLRLGQTFAYPGLYPTSGPHDPVPTPPGFYTATRHPTRLVHALEHGNIVIYYDKPGDEVLETLRSWTSLYSAPWAGVIAVAQPGIGKTVVLTAWTKRLTLPNFERPAAAAFIDLYRGRGPERPVR
jgi:hypothetical protein